MATKIDIKMIAKKTGEAVGVFFVLLVLLLAAYLVLMLGWAVTYCYAMIIKDLNLSVDPFIWVNFFPPGAWFLSISSSASQLLIPLLNTHIRGAVNDKLLETQLPLINDTEIHIVIWLNVGLAVYDFLTNFWGAWPETGNELTPWFQHFIVTLGEAIILTFSELFFVFFVALAVYCFYIGILCLVYIVGHVQSLFNFKGGNKNEGFRMAGDSQ